MRLLLTTAEDIGAFAGGNAKAYPKLGLLALIAYVRQHLPDADIEYEYHDMMLEHLTMEDLGAIAARFQPDVAGLSCLSFSEEAFHAAAAAIRKSAPSALIVGGGPYVSSLRSAVLSDENVDLLVFDEGERAFVALMRRLLEGQDYRDLRGLAYRENGVVRVTEPEPLIDDLDELPIPAFDVVDFDAYTRRNPHLDTGGRFAPIVTSRGCPFKCVYCHALHGKTTRFRSADHVMREIEHLYHAHDVRVLYVYDDIFNLDRPRAKEICERIIASKMDLAIDFLNGLRADLLDRELIDLMIDAGTYYFAYAIETATPRIQDLIKKYNRLDHVADAIEYTVERGKGRCVVATYNMIGFPTETEDEVWNTIEFNRSLSHQIADVAIAIPQENTEMFRMVTAAGFLAPKKRTPNYGKDVMMSASEKISPARLGELLRIFKSSFYDEQRQARLMELAAVPPTAAQTRHLGGFVRGFIRLSGDNLGSTNAALHAGMVQ